MDKSEKLKLVAEKISCCKLCKELCEYRKQNNYFTCPGQGNADAKLVFLGESSGENEAKSGLCFVGKAGELLSNILSAIGIKREDVFILNILKCRPPGNRNPLPKEAANCRPFLDLQLRVIQPDFIVCLGAIAANNLLHVSTPITYMRRQWYEHDVGNKKAKVLATYHPSYLLRNLAAKKQVWDDMQLLLKEINK
jgi:DNA polymerase